MSVSLIAKKRGYGSLDVSNGCWFELRNGVLSSIVPRVIGNDPINMSPANARKCAEAMKTWTPPDGWFATGKELQGVAIFIEFFEACNGFRTC